MISTAGLSATTALAWWSHNQAGRSVPAMPGDGPVPGVGRATGGVERAVPGEPAGAQQQDVAHLQRAALRGDARVELVGEHGIARALAQRPADRGAPAVEVEQDGAPDDSPGGPVVDAVSGVGEPVVEAVLSMGKVAETVPLGRGLGVEVVQDVVVDLAGAARHLVAQRGTTEQRRVRECQVEGQREPAPGADRGSRSQGAFGREQVQGAEDVVVSPESPRGSRGRVGPYRELGVAGQLVGHRRISPKGRADSQVVDEAEDRPRVRSAPPTGISR